MNTSPDPEKTADCAPKNRTAIEERIKSFRRLPALATRLLRIINDPDADALEIVDNMKFDPGLTGNVLKLANSACFGVPRSVGSLNEAVVRLGTKRLFDMVVATGMGSILRRPLSGYGLLPEQLLEHSAWVAAASEEFCEILDIARPDLMFTAGILHDIGKIVLSDALADSTEDTHGLTRNSKASFIDIEARIAGMNHAEAGALILDSWNFPEELIAAVRRHHAPGGADRDSRIAGIIHIADALAYTQGVGTGLDGMNYPVSRNTVEDLGVTARQVEYVASVTLDRMLELHRILCVHPEPTKSIDPDTRPE